MSNDLPYLFPEQTTIELKRVEMGLIEKVLLEKKWSLEGLAASRLATAAQQIELRGINGLVQRLFEVRYDNAMANWRETNDKIKRSNQGRSKITPKGYR